MSKHTHLEALEKFQNYKFFRSNLRRVLIYLEGAPREIKMLKAFFPAQSSGFHGVKVPHGLVEPYPNEAMVRKDKPVSKLQARCWRQLE